MRRTLRNALVASFTFSLSVGPALAATTGFTGSAAARITPVSSGDSGAPTQQSLSFPSATLPLQAVARVIDEPQEAAAVCGAQFADPTTVTGPDTDQFALQFAMASVTENVGFTTSSSAEERRSLVFSSSELGGASAGERVELEGRLFLDGALTVFANTSVSDLTGNHAKLRVRVTKEAEGQSPETVFDGAIRVEGLSGLQTSTTFEGGFPTFGVFTTDLSAVDESLSIFRVVVFPGLIVPYTYTASPGEAFALRASIELEGVTAGGGAGAAAVVGTPIQVLAEVVTKIADGDTANKMTSALEKERDNPTGSPAYTEQDVFLGPFAFLRACGAFGVESLVLASLLCGLRFASHGRRMTF